VTDSCSRGACARGKGTIRIPAGSGGWAPGQSSANYLVDVTDILEKHVSDWTYHAYREWAGWSVEHEGPSDATTRARQPTTREKMLTNWMAKNRKP